MSKTIVILPAGSSPYGNEPDVCKFYANISSQIKTLDNTTKVVTATYPGQKDSDGKMEGEITFKTSIEAIDLIIKSCGTEDIRLVCSSYGSLLGAALCAKYPDQISKAVLWSPIPFWFFWQSCVVDRSKWEGSNQEALRGCKVTPNIVDGIIPFEISIQSIHKTMAVIAAAEGDYPGVGSQALLDYYKSLSGYNNLKFRLLEGNRYSMAAATSPEFRNLLAWVVE